MPTLPHAWSLHPPDDMVRSELDPSFPATPGSSIASGRLAAPQVSGSCLQGCCNAARPNPVAALGRNHPAYNHDQDPRCNNRPPQVAPAQVPSHPVA
eukprot:363965-Chlamydomonas_euryale.AAC.26